MKNIKKTAIILSLIGGIVLALCISAVVIYKSKVNNSETVKLYVYPNTSIEKIEKELKDKGVLGSASVCGIYLKLLSPNERVHSGYYEINPQTTQLNLAKQLSRGLQTPVKLTINKVRTPKELAEKLSSQLMISSRDLLLAFEQSEWGVNIFDHVIANTYEVYWNISAEKLLERLGKESDKWWNGKEEKLGRSGLSRHEAVVLASIVEEETNKNDEKPIIAGVYLNRLRKDMLLQADPTVKYAVGDFSIRRVMYKHLQTESPYNTYLNKGLPPSAICLPEQSSILAVLNYAEHDYIFFCAKDDFSGYHAFAKTPNEHYANANRYQAALNRRGIK